MSVSSLGAQELYPSRRDAFPKLFYLIAGKNSAPRMAVFSAESLVIGLSYLVGCRRFFPGLNRLSRAD